MPVPFPELPVRTPRVRHTGWTSTSTQLGRPEEPHLIGKWWWCPGNFDRVEDVDGIEYTRNYLYRYSNLSTDQYAMDKTFNPNPNGRTYAVAGSKDRTLAFVVGSFSTIGGSSRAGIAAFRNSDGGLDANYFSGFAVSGGIEAAALDDDGNLWVGGTFTSIGGVSRTRLAILDVSDPSVSVLAPTVNCTDTVIDLVWDDVNKQMIVLMENDGNIT